MIVSLEAWGTNAYNRYAMCPAGLLYPVMANGIISGDTRGFNKGRSSKFRVGSRVRQTHEGRRTYRWKRCGNYDKDEENSPKTLNGKNHQASSQKF